MAQQSRHLSRAETQRYSRHLLLPEVGESGQLKLIAGKVLVVGAGGLGAPVLLYLAAAGVGKIGIVDHDTVDASNLQRQVLYKEEDIGLPKAATAQERLRQLNSLITVEAHEVRFSADNALDLVGAYDVVVDGTDNFATRYLVNDACVLSGKPNVHGAIYRFEGQLGVFSCAGGPCYRCLFPDPPPPEAVPNCAEGGVLGVMAATIGAWQATETLKILLGLGSSLKGKLLIYDALKLQVETLSLSRNENCPICGKQPRITTVQEEKVVCAVEDAKLNIVDARELHRKLQTGEQLFLLDVRNLEEYLLGHLTGATHIPLSELPSRLNELDSAKNIVVYCKSGGRSRRAAEILMQNGFAHVFNLTGGITAWSMQVDNSLPVY